MSTEKNNVGSAKKNFESNVSTPPVTPPSTDKLKDNQLGYGDKFPTNLLEEKVFDLRYKEKARKVGLIVSKSLLIINLYSPTFAGKLQAGDFVIKINEKPVKKKAPIYEFLENALKTHEKFTITVKRPKWLIATSVVPKGYDVAPGYEYFSGILVLYPNSTVGLNVKAFCSRIYVVRVETDSIAIHTCMAGDCIVDIDGDPITTVTDCSEKIIKALKEKKYVSLTIERASTPITIRAVRCALYAEKTTPIDPRLAADTQKMGEQEAAKIKTGKVPPAPKGILKTQGNRLTGDSFYGTAEKPHLAVLAESEEYTIGCEPYNPLFLNKVKQRGESKQQQVSSQQSSQSSSQGPTNNSSTGTNTATASLPNNNTLTAGSSTSGEKVNYPAQSPSAKKTAAAAAQSKSKDSKELNDDKSKRKTGPGHGSNDETDVENNSSKRQVRRDDSKRAVGGGGSGKNIKSVMSPAPIPTGGGTPSSSTPIIATTPPQPEKDDKEKKSEKSKKGLRGKTVAAFKSVTARRSSTGGNDKSQRKA